jgi:hypothetical protein
MPDCPYCNSPDTIQFLHCHKTIVDTTEFCYNIICQDCWQEFPADDYDDELADA